MLVLLKFKSMAGEVGYRNQCTLQWLPYLGTYVIPSVVIIELDEKSIVNMIRIDDAMRYGSEGARL